MTAHADNLVRRLPKHSDAWRAVVNMMDEMAEMWEGFTCDGEIVADRKHGAHVIINVPMDDCPDAWTYAYLFRNGDEFICIADFYMGEDSAYQGTEGNWYTVDDCGVLVAA